MSSMRRERQEEAMRLIRESVRRDLDDMQANVLMGQPEAMRLIREGVRRDLDDMQANVLMGQPACRTFVCQGCGRAHAVLHGRSVICRCGVTSSAEVLPPGVRDA